jgi:hypothetical protein
MIKVRLYFNDLTKERQEKIIEVFGDNCNWDVFPICELEIESDKDAIIDSFIFDGE